MEILQRSNIYSVILAGRNPEFARRAEQICPAVSPEDAAKGLAKKETEDFFSYLATCKRIAFVMRDHLEQNLRGKSEKDLLNYVGTFKNPFSGSTMKYRIAGSQLFKGNDYFDISLIRVYIKD